ncbi:MAG: hypothetical protein COA99_10220 [Moraxellaceae bacterium]|nr:MAG: hypothetical protein COA99_10220 [Moraxellaceae bacterium]
MNSVGSSSQSTYHSVPLRDARDSDGVVARRKQLREEEKEQRNQVSVPVAEREKPKMAREVTRVGSLQATSKQYEAKPVADYSSLPNSLQQALKTYAETDVFSRLDGDIDFLGSIDVFV